MVPYWLGETREMKSRILHLAVNTVASQDYGSWENQIDNCPGDLRRLHAVLRNGRIGTNFSLYFRNKNVVLQLANGSALGGLIQDVSCDRWSLIFWEWRHLRVSEDSRWRNGRSSHWIPRSVHRIPIRRQLRSPRFAHLLCELASALLSTIGIGPKFFSLRSLVYVSL